MNERKPEYYEIVPVYPAPEGEFRIANASVGTCGLCGGMATGMGGSDRQLCVRCAEVVIKGQARGAIKWDDSQ